MAMQSTSTDTIESKPSISAPLAIFFVGMLIIGIWILIDKR